MEITEIRIKLMEGSEDRLRAFCSITIDDSFVVRDLKIIDGSNGPFVAMPSRKLTGHCGRCNHKNHLRASYCNHCGGKLRGESDGGYESPQKLYADVAHPINSDCREAIQSAVINEFEAELNRAAQPGYRSRYDDDFDYDASEVEVTATEKPAISRHDDPAIESAAAPSDGEGISSTKVPEKRPSRRSSESGPPRPHFLDGGDSGPSRQSAGVDDDDSFGAGIFER